MQDLGGVSYRRTKQVLMKGKRLTYFLLLATWCLVGISCDEETGVCFACCDANKSNICKYDYSQSDCKDLNDRKADGFSWKFITGDQCPPDPPENP